MGGSSDASANAATGRLLGKKMSTLAFKTGPKLIQTPMRILYWFAWARSL